MTRARIPRESFCLLDLLRAAVLGPIDEKACDRLTEVDARLVSIG
jgi:hypothetical protein